MIKERSNRVFVTGHRGVCGKHRFGPYYGVVSDKVAQSNLATSIRSNARLPRITSKMNAPRRIDPRVLTIGMITTSPLVPRWQAEIVEILAADARFSLDTLITVAPSHVPGSDQAAGAIARLMTLPWKLADRFDAFFSRKIFHRQFKPVAYDADALIDFKHARRFASSIEVEVVCDAGDGSIGIREHELCLIGQRNLDVVINLDDLELDTAFQRVPAHGVWFLRLGSEEQERQGPPAFAEVAGNYGETIVKLCVLDGERSGTVVLARASYHTFLKSWNENRRRACMRSVHLVTDTLERLADTGQTGAIGKLPAAKRLGGVTTNLPGPVEAIGALARVCWRTLSAELSKRLYVEQWQLAVGWEGGKPQEMYKFARVIPPQDRFWADPFLFERDGVQHIFIENFPYATDKGEIAVLRFRDRELLESRTIISQPYHMSFPFCFEHGGRCFMIPETYESGAIELWEAHDFPYGWHKVKNLMEGVSSADTVLHYNDGRWWMFTNLDRTVFQDHCHELHLFWADTFDSESWTPHPLNPVVRDVSTARMAGRIVRTNDGRLLRYSQDNRFNYGYGLNILEITTLNPQAYHERRIGYAPLNRPRGVVGAHHFDRCGDVTVGDIRYRLPKLRWLPI